MSSSILIYKLFMTPCGHLGSTASTKYMCPLFDRHDDCGPRSRCRGCLKTWPPQPLFAPAPMRQKGPTTMINCICLPPNEKWWYYSASLPCLSKGDRCAYTRGRRATPWPLWSHPVRVSGTEPSERAGSVGRGGGRG
jgi:hypothetical protein